MSEHRSIGERLSRAKSSAVRLEVAKIWAQEWHDEQSALLRKLRVSITSNDKHEQLFYMQQLDAVNDKRHDALIRVFDKIGGDSNGPDR